MFCLPLILCRSGLNHSEDFVKVTEEVKILKCEKSHIFVKLKYWKM